MPEKCVFDHIHDSKVTPHHQLSQHHTTSASSSSSSSSSSSLFFTPQNHLIVIFHTNIHSNHQSIASINQPESPAPLFTTMHHHSKQCTTIHNNAPPFTTIHHPSQQFTTIHNNSPPFTDVHNGFRVEPHEPQVVRGQGHGAKLLLPSAALRHQPLPGSRVRLLSQWSVAAGGGCW